MISSKQLEDEHLLKIIIEQLKLPLLHIARQTEQAKYGTLVDYIDINSIAEMSLKMIDGFMLSREENTQTSLQLEPVSLSSALNNAANNIEGLAKLYGCSVELHLAGKYAPIMSQKDKLEAAFTMLGYSYIEASKNNENSNLKRRIILSGHKTSKGLVAGIFSPQLIVNNGSFIKSMNSLKATKQAMPGITQSTGAGIIIANSILNDLTTKLRVAHYRKISGMAATLIPSHQLQLV